MVKACRIDTRLCKKALSKKHPLCKNTQLEQVVKQAQNRWAKYNMDIGLVEHRATCMRLDGYRARQNSVACELSVLCKYLRLIACTLIVQDVGICNVCITCSYPRTLSTLRIWHFICHTDLTPMS